MGANWKCHTTELLPHLIAFPSVLSAMLPRMPLLISNATSVRDPAVAPSKSKNKVEIVSELCKGCELCVYACPSGNLVLSPELNLKGYHPAVFSYNGSRGPCSACGLCYWICPDMAISKVLRLKQ